MSDHEIAQLITNYITTGKTRFITLSGPAGTGKTTFIRQLVSNIPKSFIICPTNKSIANLATNEFLINITSTYAKFFKCYIDPLEDSITEMKCNLKCSCEYKYHSNTLQDVVRCLKDSTEPIVTSSYNLLIIEEASMFTHEFYSLLLKMNKIKTFLFVGDSNQIPAITSSCKECLHCSFSIFSCPIPILYFKSQKRQTNQTDTQLQTFMRKISDIPVLNTRNIKSTLKSIFKVVKLVDVIPLKAPIITYHVKTSNIINKMLANDRSEIVEGDLVSISQGSTSNVPVGSVVLVKSIKTQFMSCMTLERGFEFKVYTVQYNTVDHDIHVIVNREEYIQYCKEFRRDKSVHELIKINKLIREHLTSFTMAYAITAHKAQGQTYHTSLIDIEDIVKCSDKKLTVMLFYTAITRSRGEVLMVEIPDHFKMPEGDIIIKELW